MGDVRKSILVVEARENARLDLLVEEDSERALAEISKIIQNIDARDQGLWARLGVPLESDLDALAATPVADRDSEWLLALAALLSASKIQYFAANHQLWGGAAELKKREVAKADRSKRSLVTAGRLGFTTRDVEGEKKNLARVDLPQSPIRDDSDLDDVLDVLLDTGALPPPNVLLAQGLSHVAGLAEYPGDSEQWSTGVGAALASASTSSQAQMSRRAVQALSGAWIAGPAGLVADDTIQYVWISHADSSVCAPCAEMGGRVGTYDSFATKPGASTCLGGDRCRCDLVPVD